jgi:hypothetical protein
VFYEVLREALATVKDNYDVVLTVYGNWTL